MSDHEVRAGLVDLATLAHYEMVDTAVRGAPAALAARCARPHDTDHAGFTGACLLVVPTPQGGDSDNLADLAWVADGHDGDYHAGDPPPAGARTGLVDLAVLRHYQLVPVGDDDGLLTLAVRCTRPHHTAGRGGVRPGPAGPYLLVAVVEGAPDNSLAALASSAASHEADQHGGDLPYPPPVAADLQRLYTRTAMRHGIDALARALGMPGPVYDPGAVLTAAVQHLDHIATVVAAIRAILPDNPGPAGTAIRGFLDELTVPPAPAAAGPHTTENGHHHG